MQRREDAFDRKGAVGDKAGSRRVVMQGMELKQRVKEQIH